MKSSVRFSIAALTVIILGFVAVSLSRNSAPLTEPSTKLVLNVPAKSQSVAVAEIQKQEPQMAGVPRPLHVYVDSRIKSASIREALPKLEQPVINWRGYKPQKITIAPYPDTPMEFEMVSVREENGRTIWNGRNALSGAFLVTVATENDWHAVLDVPTADGFEFHISGQTLSVNTMPSTGGACGSDALEVRTEDVLTETVVTGTPVPVKADAATTFSYVDVIFFYDAATLVVNNGDVNAIANTLVARIDASNAALTNSAISNLRWRYVAAYQVPDYTTPTSIYNDLDYISDSAESKSRISDDTLRSFIKGKCDLHGADQAVLYVSGDRTASGYVVGLAWSPLVVTNTVGIGNARAVVMWKRSQDGYTSNFSVLAHEMAHNFGCKHDRVTAAAPDDDGQYWYGHVLTVNGSDYGTIMSYLGTTIPYFSNPDVSYSSVPTGVAVGAPKAANNAKVLADNGAAMASFRSLVIPRSSSSSSGGDAPPAILGGGVTPTGSSGGGGAPSDWFGLTLIVLGAARVFGRAHRLTT